MGVLTLVVAAVFFFWYRTRLPGHVTIAGGPEGGRYAALAHDYDKAQALWRRDFAALGLRAETSGRCPRYDRETITLSFAPLGENTVDTTVRVVSGGRFEKVRLTGTGGVSRLVLVAPPPEAFQARTSPAV